MTADAIAQKIETFIERSSWIRKMFEEGARLKAEHGADKVFDFSLGNPNVPPPARFREVLRDLAENSVGSDHIYMPNTGYPHVRKAVADYVSREQGAALTENEIVMTCGAAGALNIILKAILNPGEELLVPAPFFVEYGFYADNHGGVMKTVRTNPDFTLDLAAIGDGITDKTRAVLINSPNNPTGQVYSRNSLEELGKLLSEKSEALGKTIYLLSDEPYRKIVYDGVTVPSIFLAYENSLIATSYSKDLSIAGERLGYAAINPRSPHKDALAGGLALANRILGFVNAPALMQRVVARLQGESGDMDEYTRKRQLLCNGLQEAGYDFVTPAGAFYLFPKTPIPDDVEFVRALQDELILAVPGAGFGGPGHFRLSFCVSDETITGAMPGFKRAMEKFL